MPFKHPDFIGRKKKKTELETADSIPGNSKIVKEANKAWRTKRSWVDPRTILVGVSVGSFLALFSYVYAMLRKKVAVWKTEWPKDEHGDTVFEIDKINEYLPEAVQDFLSFPYPVYTVFIWTTAATFTTLFAWSRGKWRWYRRHFLGRVNFSLNSITPSNTLQFRTLFERSLYDMMFRNQAAVKLVANAAQKTTVEQPFLMIPADENWYVLNNILNEISSIGMVGFLQNDNRIPVKQVKYIFGLSCEKDPGVWSKKLRVMLIREDVLDKIIETKSQPEMEEEHHSIRWKTLKIMARIWKAQKDKTGSNVLGRIQLCIPFFDASTFELEQQYKESESREEEEM